MAKEHMLRKYQTAEGVRQGAFFAPVLRKGECGEAVENERGICYTFLIAKSRKPDAKPVDYGGGKVC
mgnify:CR=1 FL=1